MADDRWSDRDERGEGRGRYRGGPRGYAAGGQDADRQWRQMHRDRRHEGAAGYNAAGPIQGGWEYGDDGRGYYDEYGRDPRGPEREYGRGGGQGAAARGARDYGYGAHTPYGYRGPSEYDRRGRGGDYAEGGRGREDRSWLERAGERVSSFFGADGEGQHRGRGPKGYRRSDERIREDVSDRLTDDPWLDASNIEVVVRECEVVLSGTVSTREDKRRAENLVEAVSGVKNVANNLRVEDWHGETGMFEGMRTQSGQTAMGEQATPPKGKDLGGGASRQ
jgi:osmotically-inducible protein OsmY